MMKAISSGTWDEFISPKVENGPERYVRTPKSITTVPLVAGDYVPIKVKMMHSVHNSLFEDGNSYVYL